MSQRKKSAGGLRITRWEAVPDGFLLAFMSSSRLAFGDAVWTVKGLPLADREWCRDEGCWWIAERAVPELARRLPELRALLEEEAAQASGRGRAAGATASAASPAMPPAVAAAFSELYLLPTAPDVVVKAAFRALAKIHHPDVGGSNETMRRLNDAYERAENWLATRAQGRTAQGA